MTRLHMPYAVTFLAMFGVLGSLGNAAAKAQVGQEAASQSKRPTRAEDDTISEPPPVQAEVGNDVADGQPINLSSPTDEASRLAGDGERPIQKSTLTAAQRAGFEMAAVTALGLHAVSVQEVEAVSVSKVRKVAVTLNGAPRVLELYPHSLRSENFRLVEQGADGLLVGVAPPPITTYRGSVMGDITSQVAASIIDGKVHATIIGRDGSWAVQPLGQEIAGAPADLHAVFRIADVIPPGGECGIDHVPPAVLDPDTQDGEVSAEALGTGGRTQIAFDCDNEYYVANGSSTANTLSDLEMIMNQVALVYLGEFSPDICYVNEGVIVRTAEPDPYTTTNSSSLLCQFRNEWNNNSPISNRDVVHLMTGKNLAGTTIGVAYIGVVCNVSGFTTTTNCTNTANLAYGLSQTFFSANIVARTALTAHELGHNWNACHCNQSTCTGNAAADADCGIMNSFAGALQSTLLFGSRSTSTMNAHRNSRTCLSGCTGTTYVDLTNPTTGSGSQANPYRSLTDGIDWMRTGGTVRIFGGNYSGLRTIRKFLNLERQDGTVNVGG